WRCDPQFRRTTGWNGESLVLADWLTPEHVGVTRFGDHRGQEVDELVPLQIPAYRDDSHTAGDRITRDVEGIPLAVKHDVPAGTFDNSLCRDAGAGIRLREPHRIGDEH